MKHEEKKFIQNTRETKQLRSELKNGSPKRTKCLHLPFTANFIPPVKHPRKGC